MRSHTWPIGLRAPEAWRSYMRGVVETFQPWLTGPSSRLFGTSTSVKKTSLKWWWPVASTSGRTLTPGDRRSTSRQLMPLCLGTLGSVRPSRMIESAYCDHEAYRIRVLRARGPHFLPVDQVMVAAVLGARAKARQVGAGPGLGEALGPDLVRVEDLRQVLALLLVGAPVDDGRAHEVEPHARQHRGVRPRVLLVPDDPLEDRRPPPARPGR